MISVLPDYLNFFADFYHTVTASINSTMPGIFFHSPATEIQTVFIP